MGFNLCRQCDMWYSEFLETRHIVCERSIENVNIFHGTLTHNVMFLRILNTTCPVSEKLGLSKTGRALEMWLKVKLSLILPNPWDRATSSPGYCVFLSSYRNLAYGRCTCPAGKRLLKVSSSNIRTFYNVAGHDVSSLSIR